MTEEQATEIIRLLQNLNKKLDDITTYGGKDIRVRNVGIG